MPAVRFRFYRTGSKLPIQERFMSKTSKPYSLKEEIFNSITHGIGTLLGVAALVILVVMSVNHGNVWHIVSTSIFGASIIILYMSSTLYHSLTAPKAKHVFKILDHSSIFILIAGTYTPFLLVTLRGPWGWSLFGVIWGLAVSGIVMKSIFIRRFKILSTIIYLLMGWIVIIALKPLLAALPKGGFLWLFGGGLSYSLGVVFYEWKKLPMSHGIWHLFVIGGTVCHFFSVLFYVVPLR